MNRTGPAVGLLSLVALLVTNRSFAAGALPEKATAVQREQAQAEFERGKEAMAHKNYDYAIAAFRASYEIVASPNTRFEIGKCLRATGDLVQAYAELGRASVEALELREADNRYDRTNEAATAIRRTLQGRLAFISLRIDNPVAGTRVKVGDEEIVPAGWADAVPVHPGHADVIIETPGREPVHHGVELIEGSHISLILDAASGALESRDLPELQTPSTSKVTGEAAGKPRMSPLWMRPGAYVAGGIGVVGLASFAVFGLMAHSTYDNLNRICIGGACPRDQLGNIGEGKTDQTIANIGLALGIAGAAGCATLFLLSPGERPAPSVALVASPGWIGLRGAL